jgi:hypothetical protein
MHVPRKPTRLDGPTYADLYERDTALTTGRQLRGASVQTAGPRVALE